MPQIGANNSVPCGEQVVMGEQTQAIVLSRSTEAMEGLRQKGDQEREGTNRNHKVQYGVALFCLGSSISLAFRTF